MHLDPLNLAQLNQEVERFNQLPIELASDGALHEAFALPLTRGRIALCLFSVNEFWLARARVNNLWPCENLVRLKLDRLDSLVEEIRTYSMPVGDEDLLTRHVIEPALKLMEEFLAAGTNVNYVFVTKFLHWWAGTPPVDKKAGKAIRKLTGKRTCTDTPDIKRRLEQFSELIKIYNCWLNQLVADCKLWELRSHDFRTQTTVELRYWNSPTRIIDKYLWLRVKDNYVSFPNRREVSEARSPWKLPFAPLPSPPAAAPMKKP
jgi:hypothetical protein